MHQEDVLYLWVICRGEKTMRVSYNGLWKVMIDKNMKKYQLKEVVKISSNSIAKLGKSEAVSLEVLIKYVSP